MSSIPPLHLAASRGDLIKVQELVRKGAALETKSDDGLTPVMHSIHNNHKDVASYLVKQMTGKDLAVEDIFGYNVLHYLARDGRPWLQLMKIVCEKCPEAIQKVNYKGRQPIDVAREMLDDDPRQSEYREIIQCLETLAQYQVKKGIAEKSIQTCNITITFIGNNGSGKTCLRKQLSREEFPIDGPGSTNLVEFLANYLDWDPLTGTRQKLGEGGEEETGVERLRRIFKRYNAQQTSNTLGTGQNESATESSEDSQLQDQRRDVSPIPDMDVDHSQQELVGDILHQYDDDTYWFDTEMDDDVPYDDESEENEYEYENKELDNPKEKESDTIKGFITLYDFGGEIIFYNTHHCFMSGDMVFILVFNVAMCIDSVKGEKEIKSIESWLCSVGTYAVDDSDTQKGIPPILLVGSHLDQVPGTEDEKLQVFGSILDKLYENRRIRHIMEKHVHDMFPISNLNDSTQQEDIYEKIWKKIFEIAPLQSEWKTLVPARWVAIEQELLKRKGRGVDIMTYQDLKELNKTLLVPLSDEDDIRCFLKKLRMTGSMLVVNLYHNPVIILNPNFILDALKCIITDPKFTRGFKERQRWNAFAKSGKLPFSDLHVLWSNETPKDFSKNQDIIKVAFETFGLFAKPITDELSVDYYIVPCMLLESDPESLQPLLSEPDVITSSTVCFKFEKEFIPHAIWDKVVASCIHRFHSMDEPGQDQSIFIRRRFVCLAVDYLWNMILNCNGNAMKVTMFKRHRDDGLLQGTGIQIRNVLEYLLRNVLELNRQNHLKYHFCLHNDYRFSPNDKMVNIQDLKSSSLSCYGASGRGWISLDDYHFWFLNTGMRRRHHPDTAERLITEGIPDRRPSLKETGRIAKLISGRVYQMFFTELFLRMHVLDQIMEETRNVSFRTSITKALLHVLNTRHEIGFAEIACAMQKHGMPYDDLSMTLDTDRVDVFRGVDVPNEVLNKLISTLNLDVVAEHICAKSCFNFFIELGLDNKAIDRTDVDHDKVNDRIRALLDKWSQDDGEKATINKLLLAMMECDMDTKSLKDHVLRTS